MKTVTINAFLTDRSIYKRAINLFNLGNFAVLGNCTYYYWVMDEDFDCKATFKPSFINKLIECGFLEKRDNRLYKSPSAPYINLRESNEQTN